MSRIAKIYCSKAELPSVAPTADTVENYDAFQVVNIQPADLKKVAAKVPVEDITSLFQIRMGGKLVDSGRHRYTAKGKTISHPAYKGAAKLSPGQHHYIVQFHGPVKELWIRRVKKAGAEYRGPYRDFAGIFRMTNATLAKVNALPFVRWIGHLTYESRIARGVLRRSRPGVLDPSVARGNMFMGPGGTEVPDTLVVQFFGKKELTAAKSKFRRCKAKLISMDGIDSAVVTVPADAAGRKAAIEALSKLHGVRLITNKVLPSTHNNVATGLMGTAKSVATSGLGLSGEGEIVAIADTGLDTGVVQTLMADFSGRVKAIHSWPVDTSFTQIATNVKKDDGAADLDSGHGTHVAGSVLGAGSPGAGGSAGIRGLAHQAKLVFQAVEQKLQFASVAAAKSYGNDPFQLAGLPSNLAVLFQQAYDDGARIHSDSWGGGDPGDYDSTSRQLDKFVWENPDFCVLVAAGNEGTDAAPGSDGVVNEGSVSSPGTAKNCITVGASQSERPAFVQDTFGIFWPDDFPKKPLKTEPVAGDREKMAAFSSRGPTKDGRIKPDVVAPGTYILSTRSTQLPAKSVGWGVYGANPKYMYEGGTSMATPLVAGAVALLRQFYRTRQNTPSPSAALLKATLICGAQRMPLPYVPAGALADNHQGFGRVDLDTVLAPTGGAVFGFQDVRPGLRTGEAFEVAVAAAANRPLRVVLAYSDWPGLGLKNNLNLLLIAPDGSRRVGNSTGNTLVFDAKNNVEVVAVPAPTAGPWRIQILGGNVPQSPQPFALAWLA